MKTFDADMVGVGLANTVVFGLLGIPLQPVMWGLFGGFLGTGWAKPMPFFRSAGIYLCASLLSALVGSALGDHFYPGTPSVANALAAFISVFFHPSLAAIAERVPAFFDVLLSAIGKRGQS